MNYYFDQLLVGNDFTVKTSDPCEIIVSGTVVEKGTDRVILELNSGLEDSRLELVLRSGPKERSLSDDKECPEWVANYGGIEYTVASIRGGYYSDIPSTGEKTEQQTVSQQ